MNERDIVHLQNMLDAAQASQRFVTGKSRTSLDTNKELNFALQMAIELVGRAGMEITPETRALHPQIAPKHISDLANDLLERYFDIDLDEVWRTVTEDIPPLIAQLEAILPPLTDDAS